ncbi:Fatty acid desaturase [Roseovarius nanhaiticus]|uniref:Fatty acid desaturase n=2 Tax=Roseovarius nanhaiticus TaxID=573024 RepID=A0A1N7EZ71_9RHOB|nr:Fatty acid desaturase [Roseovarius nanhaiticus]SIR93371.1 Fatty acid desaturase [Roseovarius nanhaiticus]
MPVMDHKAFISQLSPDTLAALSAVENAAGLRHLAGHTALIGALALWIALGWPLWQVAVLLQGIAICFLFTLEHETTHKTPFRNAPLNEWVGRICGVLLLLPFEWFRYFHLAHHRHTNDPDKDPELLSGMKPETWGDYIRHVSGLPYWLGMARVTWDNARGRMDASYIPGRARPRIIREARVMLAIYAGVLASLAFTPLLFWIWLLPVLVGQPFLRLYLLAEHGRCAFVSNMLENTRTTYTNRIVRFLAWNMPYHIEHHTLPNVPFHQLPALHAHMQGHHGVTQAGYAAFTADYARDLR